MQLKSLFVLASLAVSSFAQATVAQVESDITNNIAPALATLLQTIDAFPTSGGTLAGALAIHTASTNLVTAVNDATDDVNSDNTPVSDADATTIIGLIQDLVPNIQQAATDLEARKTALESLALGGVTALVQQDLTALSTATNNFENALIARTPSAELSAAQAVQATINTALNGAIADFN